MLETIRHEIQIQADAPDFDTFFNQYICDMQDTFINMEMKHILQSSTISANNMVYIIENTYKGLLTDNKKFTKENDFWIGR